MISVEEASSIIQNHSLEYTTVFAPLEESTGQVLAEKIVADRDFPPFNRVMMDGIAVAYETLKAHKGQLPVRGLIPAGTPLTSMRPDEACEIMTGAVVPEGLDTIIPYEEVEFEETGANRLVKVNLNLVKQGQHIHMQSSDVVKGTTIIEPGKLISPAEVAILATVGKSTVKIVKPLHVAIVSTGDELVDITRMPQPHQIRRSNSYALVSALKQLGCKADQYHINDDKTEIKERLEALLIENDVLILSGGVSKGKKDFVPEVLDELKVEKLFHRIKQRPGKPFWFGRSDKGSTVFAFPGNPVSTFLCFQKYFIPWFYKSTGRELSPQYAKLASGFSFEPKLTYYLQVRITNKEGVLNAEPLAGGGSGDLANLTQVDGFLELPADLESFSAGEVYPLISFR